MTYNVTLARQPRRLDPECCDHCLGNQIDEVRGFKVDTDEWDEVIIHQWMMENRVPHGDGPDQVRVYNVLVPGLGTQQFTLHPACAESLRH